MSSNADQQVRVSVLMPMRNAASYVEDALRSILIEQVVPLEVIVVDDGSTDASRTIVEALEDPRVTIVDGPCRGIAAAFNAALERARGDIIMRCDADDLYPPGRIERQLQWLDTHTPFGAVCGGFSAMDDRGKSELQFGTPPSAEETTSELKGGITRTHLCTFGIRSSVLQSTGGMRSFFLTGEDIDLQLRIGEACRVWYSPEIAYRYRIHGSSITHQRNVEENLFFENLAREFQKQRKIRGTDDLSEGKPPQIPDFGLADRQSAKSHMQDLLIGRAWAAFADRNYRQAITFAVQGALAKPRSLKGWRNLSVSVVKIPAHWLASLARNHK